MATTSFLYHAQGLQGYQHLRTEYGGGFETHHIERHPRKRRCGGCGARWSELVFDGAWRCCTTEIGRGSMPEGAALSFGSPPISAFRGG